MMGIQYKNKIIYLGLGANLRNCSHTNIKVLLANIEKRLNFVGVRVQIKSNLFISSPLPYTAGPNYINCVYKCLIIGNKSSTPDKLYNNIEKIEETLGKKKKKNLSKFIDIDILDFGGIIRKDQLVLPHPRLHLRLFVLAPLKEVSPCWEHPVYKKNTYYLMGKVKTEQIIRKL